MNHAHPVAGLLRSRPSLKGQHQRPGQAGSAVFPAGRAPSPRRATTITQ